MLTGIDIHEVPGATGWYDTDYEGKRDCALDALADGASQNSVREIRDETNRAGPMEKRLAAIAAERAAKRK